MRLARIATADGPRPVVADADSWKAVADAADLPYGDNTSVDRTQTDRPAPDTIRPAERTRRRAGSSAVARPHRADVPVAYVPALGLSPARKPCGSAARFAPDPALRRTAAPRLIQPPIRRDSLQNPSPSPASRAGREQPRRAASAGRF